MHIFSNLCKKQLHIVNTWSIIQLHDEFAGVIVSKYGFNAVLPFYFDEVALRPTLHNVPQNIKGRHDRPKPQCKSHTHTPPKRHIPIIPIPLALPRDTARAYAKPLK